MFSLGAFWGGFVCLKTLFSLSWRKKQTVADEKVVFESGYSHKNRRQNTQMLQARPLYIQKRLFVVVKPFLSRNQTTFDNRNPN